MTYPGNMDGSRSVKKRGMMRYLCILLLNTKVVTGGTGGFNRGALEGLLTLERDELNDLPAAASVESSAWWGQDYRMKSGGSDGVANAQFKRMSNLMRRQLQPFTGSYIFVEPTDPPTMEDMPTIAPSSFPSPLPTPMPSPLPTPVPTGLAAEPTGSPMPTSELISPEPTVTPAPTLTKAPTRTETPAPTTFDATQAVLLLSSIRVEGVEEGDFDENGLMVVQFALNDVISFLNEPSDVIDATTTIVVRRRRHLLQTGNDTAIIDYVVFLDTPAEAGFTSSDQAVEVMESQVEDAAETGYLQERINYWASYFGSAFMPVIPEELPPGNGTWVFAPTAAPTPVSQPPSASPMPTSSPAPTTSPAPTITIPPTSSEPTASPAPTTSPRPTASPAPTPEATAEPTASPAPTSSPAPSTSPAPVAPTPEVEVEPTLAPVLVDVGGGGSKKKSSGPDAGLLAGIIIACIVGFLILLCCCWCYAKQRERKMTERKDSWDISTMFTDEANLPEAEEQVVVEDEGAGVDDVGGGAIVATDEGAIEPVEDVQPQELQKITQAAEL